MAIGQVAWVRMMCSFPTTAKDGEIAAATLTAEARTAGNLPGNTTALIQNTVDDPTKEDIVFADIAGPDDSDRDAKHSARTPTRSTPRS
jgi:hypothetical protein